MKVRRKEEEEEREGEGVEERERERERENGTRQQQGKCQGQGVFAVLSVCRVLLFLAPVESKRKRGVHCGIVGICNLCTCIVIFLDKNLKYGVHILSILKLLIIVNLQL